MISIEVEIEDPAWSEALADPAGLALSAVEAARIGGDATLAILLTDDRSVRDLNLRFRGLDKATNVLSFASAVGGHLGDVALAFGVCMTEATAQDKPLADHLRHLVIHGVLHLIGYDHQSDGEAERMEAIEVELLADLGIRDPYLNARDQEDHVQPGR